MKYFRCSFLFILMIIVLFFPVRSFAVENFILSNSPITNKIERFLSNPKIAGVSVFYSWSQLEKEKEVYDFSIIEKDLKIVKKYGKKLSIMVRDKSFKNNPILPAPDDLKKYIIGNKGTGYIVERWNPIVGKRFRKLIEALGKRFNHEDNFFAFKTSETATGFAKMQGNLPKTYTKEGYTKQMGLNIIAMAKAFPDKEKFFYMNWSSRGVSDMKYWAKIAIEYKVGLGGPDIHPDVNMPSYKVFKKLNNRTPVMMDIQWSNYSHTKVKGDVKELYDYAVNELGAEYICWLMHPKYINEIINTISNN